jgi:hypothetical protein
MSSDRSFTDFSNRRRNNGLFWGFALVLVGIIFLIREFTGFEFRNWWALFILIPAIGSFSTAWYAFQRDNRINEAVRGSLGGGLIVLTIAVMFLFDMNWSHWWPLMLIVPGFVMLLNGFSLPGSREIERPLTLRLYRPWIAWNGLGAIYLGFGFLVNNLNIYNPAALLHNWWAIAILIPAVGGVFTALVLFISGNGLGWAGISNLTTTAIYACVGLVALFGLSWNLLLPVIIIAVGLTMLLGVFRRGV